MAGYNLYIVDAFEFGFDCLKPRRLMEELIHGLLLYVEKSDDPSGDKERMAEVCRLIENLPEFDQLTNKEAMTLLWEGIFFVENITTYLSSFQPPYSLIICDYAPARLVVVEKSH